MKPPHHIALVLAFLLLQGTMSAADEVVSGSLTVEGRMDLLEGPFSLGTASFFDPQNVESTGEGFTIHYSETPHIWLNSTLNSYEPGRSTVIQRVAQEQGEFFWQVSLPGPGGVFTPDNLMKLSTERLEIWPAISGYSEQNTLPNQTLDGGSASILTKSLGDGLYLSNAGGTIAGNITISGSMSVATLTGSFTGQGTDNRLPNQIANHVNSILTKGIADGLYLSSGSLAGIAFKFGSDTIATSEHSIVLGHRAKANTNAISIGSFASNMGENMASGTESVALGYVARAPGNSAIGIGTSSWAAGEASLSLGNDTGAYTNRGVAIGKGSISYVPGQVSIGNFNVIGNISHNPWHADPIFIVGNGTADDARSNAFLIRRNGDVDVVGSLTVQGTDSRLPNQVAVHDTSILTRAAADARYFRPGTDLYSFASGYMAEATPWTSSVAIGYQAMANEHAISIGHMAGKTSGMVSAPYSIGLGYASRASGIGAIAIGSATNGANESSVAISHEACAWGFQSIAIGKGTQAARLGQVVLGNFNAYDTHNDTPSASDKIFVIGNGTADNARSNAFVIKRNGDVEVKGTSLTVNGSEVLTKAGSNYIKLRDDNVIIGGGGAYVADWSGGLAIGGLAWAGENAVSIGNHAGYMGGMTSGEKSVSLGYAARAAGKNGIALGEASWAAGESAIVVGKNSSGYAKGAVAIGEGAVANQINQVVLGSYNQASTYSPTTPLPTDDLLVLGNGLDESSRSNAFVVKRNGDTEIKGAATVAAGLSAQQLTIAQSAQFGTVLSGTSINGFNSLTGYTFDVAQGTETHPVEITHSSWVEGYETFEYGSEDVWGWVMDGYWQDQWGPDDVIGQEYINPVYDENGAEIQPGYYQNIWGPVYLGQVWVPQEYWGIVGSNPTMTSVWHDGYTNTWTELVDETSYSTPRLQFSASRSDANWVWRNPSYSNPGSYDDVLVVWNGGLRIPTSDPNRAMALTAESLSQSVATSNYITGSTSSHFTNLGALSLEVTSVTTEESGNLITEKVLTNPQRITISTTSQEGGSSIHRQTTIGAASSTLEGAVQINGSLNVSGGVSFGGVSMTQIFVPIASTTIHLGASSTATTGGIALGEGSVAKGKSISIGYESGLDVAGGILPGENSIAIGSNTVSVGENALALGKFGFADGTDSIALGTESKTLRNLGIAIGAGAESTRAGQIVLGAYNLQSTPSSLISSDDDLLVIGNGTSDTERSNALVLKRNGDLHIQGGVLTVDGEPVLTVAAANLLFASSTMTGYLSIATANDTFQAKAPTGAHFILDTEIGSLITPLISDSETSQRAVSNNLYLGITQAQADYLSKQEASQTYIDEQALEDALAAFAVSTDIDDRYLQKDAAVGLSYGTGATAAAGSVALGTSAASSGSGASLAVGVSAVANNQGTRALGTGVVANRPDQTVVGAFNDYGTQLVNDGTKAPDDALFVVGSGTSDLPAERKNAMEVKRNGDVDVGGVLRVKPAGNLSMGAFTTGPQP